MSGNEHEPCNKSEAEWRAELSNDVYQVTRKAGTERAFSGQYYQHHEVGTYLCACCQTPLFSSLHKYDSGSGWPSYWQPIDEEAIKRHID